MAEPFARLCAAAAPLMRANIDTDTISPGSRPAGKIAPQTFGEYGSSTLAADLFANWRYLENGEEDPAFVLNRPPFRRAKILIAGPNFGCGSSRESAVWMLKEWGIRCIVAPSFGEIFYGSCFKNGLLPVVLPEADVERLAREAEPGEPEALFEIDLTRDLLVTPSGERVRIELPKIRRDALLTGRDDIDLTLERYEEIARFEVAAAADHAWLYWPRVSA
jgi:3-isopropylmalate/(R)-2-methylmalate dehydratase small subunit